MFWEHTAILAGKPVIGVEGRRRAQEIGLREQARGLEVLPESTTSRYKGVERLESQFGQSYPYLWTAAAAFRGSL